MNTDNVTPICGGEPPTQPPARRRPGERRKCPRFHLAEPDDAPGNMRLIQALHGVCYAIEQLAEHGPDAAIGLGTAAEILSEMLQDRIT